MKRFNLFSAILAVVLVVSMCILPAAATVAQATESKTACFRGDVNNNGEIEKYDYILVKRYIMKTVTFTDEQLVGGDVNANGELEKFDYILIKRHVMKTYTIEEKHNVISVEAKDATCTEKGNIAYFACANCGKCFQDYEAKHEMTLEDVEIKATGHKYSTLWSMDETAHWHASICGHSLELADYSEHTYYEGICTSCEYTQRSTYLVTFVDYNNTIIDIQEVQAGTSAVAPGAPSRANYVFMGWDASFDNIYADITVKAIYIRQYTVTFVDYDGTVLKTEVVNSGDDAIAPPHSTRPEYEANGWDKSYSDISENTIVTALYKAKTFMVTFKTPDGVVIPYVDNTGIEHFSQIVEYGACAEVPNYSDVFEELYFDWETISMKKFSGWDKDVTRITSDTVVTAEYNDYYSQPVIAIEQIDKIVSVKMYMPEATHLYALDFGFIWTGSIGISSCFIEETSNVLYLTDNISKSIDYNNKQKTFQYSWTCAKGVKVPSNDKYFDVVDITFSTSGGSQLSAESLLKDCTLVFGTDFGLPIEELIIIRPIVVIK